MVLPRVARACDLSECSPGATLVGPEENLMSFGLVEVITLLMGLAGFSVQPNPRTATPDQALQYAMPDADVVLHVDAVSLVPHNYKVLTQLPNQPQIKASPELAKAVRKAIGEVEGVKGLAKATTGLDVTTDIHDATLFVQVPATPAAGPTVLVTVRGKFTTQMIDRVAKMTRPATRIGAGAMIELQDPAQAGQRGGPDIGAIAVTKDGTFLAGSAKLVRDRLADSWRAPARAPGSPLAHVADMIAARPVFAVALTMSPSARKQALAALKTKNFLSDVVERHRLATFSVFHDGIGWTWIDRTKPGLEAMALVSEGSMEVLRAAQIAPRGVAKIILGALESYRGTNKQVDELLRHKADLWKLVQSYTGDGSFKVQIDKNPATLRLTARATGKSLSEVVPAGFFVPVGMVAFLGVRSASPPPAMSQPAIAVPPARPAPRKQPPPRKQPAPAPRP